MTPVDILAEIRTNIRHLNTVCATLQRRYDRVPVSAEKEKLIDVQARIKALRGIAEWIECKMEMGKQDEMPECGAV